MTDTPPLDGPGAITIARHGEPDADRRQRVTWRGYEEWWKGYDLAGLRPDQTAPPLLVEQTAQARSLYASTLPRAIETGQACAQGRELEIDPMFVEAALPPPPMPGRFQARTWGVFARCSWWLGYSRGLESRALAERRASQAADKVITASQEGPVVLFAHGWFNRMMRPELVRRGWTCVRDGGDTYWSWRRYEYRP